MQKVTPSQNGKDDLSVEVIGAPVLRRALESYLQSLLGAAFIPNKARRIILIVGQEGQESVKSRRAGRQVCRKSARYVLLTSGADIDYALARDLPIEGFIADDDPPETFLDGLRAAAAGVPFCSSRLVTALVAAALPAAEAAPLLSLLVDESPVREKPPELTSNRRQKHPLGLSAREAEIVSHAAHGLSNNEIADRLYLSLPTIKFHLYRAYQKIGIRRRSQLAGVLAEAD